MARRTHFRMLIASDGSVAATAALETATSWPWPEPTQAFGIVAEPPSADGRFRLRSAGVRAAERVRLSVEQALGRRWPDADVNRHFGQPVTIIVREAKRSRADLIVMGWRGHLRAACASTRADLLVLGATGATGLRGLLLGSVAQSALDRSRLPVLIVR